MVCFGLGSSAILGAGGLGNLGASVLNGATTLGGLLGLGSSANPISYDANGAVINSAISYPLDGSGYTTSAGNFIDGSGYSNLF